MNAPKRLVLHGFDHGTCVRTVRMLLAAKGAACGQVPVDVPAGEPRARRSTWRVTRSARCRSSSTGTCA